jgi:hypothetical protein
MRIGEATGLERVVVAIRRRRPQGPRYQAMRPAVFVSADIDVCALTKPCAERSNGGENDRRAGVSSRGVPTITGALRPNSRLGLRVVIAQAQLT